MTSPRVSAVIATRNRPHLLREAIDAALAQDYPGDIEVIAVFDQSEPDTTIVVGDANCSRSVRVVQNRHSPGLAGARNTGIEAATGEFVAFCDDDDLWLPGKISRQVGLLGANPESAMVTCGIRVDYGGESFTRTLERDRVDFDELLRDRHTELHPSTFLMRRDALVHDIGYVEEEVPGGFGEDYEFLLRAAKYRPILNIREPLAVIRWGEQSFFFRRWETMAAGLTWLLERYPEFETSRHGSARVQGQIAFAHASMGHRRTALTWAGQAVRRNPLEPRAALAVAVAAGLVRPDRVMETLHRRGKGI